MRHPTAAALLQNYSVEVTAHSRHAVEACRANLPPGTEVYIAFVPGKSHHRLADTAAALARAGFVPVPHVTARSFSTYTHVVELLTRLRNEAGVDRALVVGGDLDSAFGPFHSALELLQTGLFAKHGFARIGLACYPEPHRRIGTAELDAALVAKVALVGAQGMEPWLVTQFCFEAAPIVARIERLRAQGITAPLQIGLAGPMDHRTLWKYALHCGIGNSIRALGTRVEEMANLLALDTPDALVADLAAALHGRPGLGVAGLHFFPFGAIARTASWVASVQDAD